MAGIEAYPQALGKAHAVVDRGDLLEGPPDFAALAGHRLERDKDTALILLQNLVKPFDELFNAGLRTCTDM